MMARFLLLCLVLAMAEVLVMSVEQEPMELKNPSKVEIRNTNAISEPPVSASASAELAQPPDYRRLGGHHSSDRSMAGGGVIIGGLVTFTFATVFCYIRVTRRRNDEK
ncbi:hypothetical protein NE237_032847 [Protea cynaroides]|uniref:Transmembrane protein n=1 Tax=Protea cynaroides TaxID=273540 RepID=A0A9Q0L4C5_9MAGN|nr:hypothetical protein NE237_032847 [Protea cynaroides]